MTKPFRMLTSYSARQPKRVTHEKWADFDLKFWHCEGVCGISERQFKEKYERWCRRNGYRYSADKAEDIYAKACGNIGLLPMCESRKILVTQAIIQLQAIEETLAAIKSERQKLASTLPEYDTVMALCGVGKVLEPQLIAAIGDVSRFKSKKSLNAFTGIDAPLYQSRTVNVQSRNISKYRVRAKILNQPSNKPNDTSKKNDRNGGNSAAHDNRRNHCLSSGSIDQLYRWRRRYFCRRAASCFQRGFYNCFLRFRYCLNCLQRSLNASLYRFCCCCRKW